MRTRKSQTRTKAIWQKVDYGEIDLRIKGRANKAGV